jgi:hypothetical protein
MFSKGFKKHLKGFGSGFAELHAKFQAGALLDFAIHRRQNETRNRKKTLVQKQCVFTARCHVAD